MKKGNTRAVEKLKSFTIECILRNIDGWYFDLDVQTREFLKRNLVGIKMGTRMVATFTVAPKLPSPKEVTKKKDRA